MIKLISAEYLQDYRLQLRFSDGSTGVLDFTPLVTAGTSMTEPLREAGFFQRFYLELGALCWPNGFELSAVSLRQRLAEAGLLRSSSAAA